MKALIDRLRDRCLVDAHTQCWRWQQTLNSAGAPCIHISGLTPHPMPVRRLMWCLACGPIHKKRIVVASCGDPLCVNPQHLQTRQRADHARQLLRELNLRRTSFDRRRTADEVKRKRADGKLCQERAEQIRRLLDQGKAARLVAAEFCISVGYLYKIKAGKRWAGPRAAAWHP